LKIPFLHQNLPIRLQEVSSSEPEFDISEHNKKNLLTPKKVDKADQEKTVNSTII
jgi:hypothetical protein